MNQYITLLALSFIFFTACNRTSAPNTKEQTSTQSNPADLIGQWEYNQQICKDGKSYQGKFLVSIDKSTLTLEGNPVECNACFTSYKATETKIIFQDEGAACTEMECADLAKYCAPDDVLTYLFRNLEYEIKGETLLLKRGTTTLKLTKQLTE